MKYIFHLLLFACIFTPSTIFGQSKPGAPRLGLGWTGLLYTGDLTVDETDYLRLYPGANMYLQFANQKAFRMRINAGFGKVVEQLDTKFQTQEEIRRTNTYFETNLFYLDFRLMRYFFRKGPVHPYLGIGPSVFFFNPKDENGNFLIDNIFTRELGEEFPTTIFVWPATIGLNVPLGNSLSLHADYTYRLNMSDYIDNIGLLGRSAGNDQLHAFQLGFDVRLGIRKNPKTDAPVDNQALQPIILASNKPQRSLSNQRNLQYRKIEKRHHVNNDHVNELEVDFIRYYEMPKSTSLNPAEVYTAEDLQSFEVKFQGYYFEQLVNIARKKNLYRKVKSNGTLSAAALAEIYHLDIKEFERLNPDLAEPVPHGQELTIPNWEAVIRLLED